MKKILAISLCCFLALTISACQNKVEVVDGSEMAVELETDLFSGSDFALRIDTLPYRGAVLFIDYHGETDISEYELMVDVALKDSIMQEEMPVEYVDGNMVAEIVDLMYLPGDELDFVLKINKGKKEIYEFHHADQLQRYPWKDWMLDEGEWFTIYVTDPDYPNFIYDYPSHPNKSGSHSSWDFWTTPGKTVQVYAGTIGMIHRILPEGNLEIYNPYVGAVVQYGHTELIAGFNENSVIMPGAHIADIVFLDEHIHYSVYRPYRYTNNSSYHTYSPPDEWANYYWPIQYDDHGLYDDPFYWHEPTTLGYWNEDTLPTGLKDEMLSKFQIWNPDLILPIMKPSGGKLTYLSVNPGSLTPTFTEGGSAYSIEVDHVTESIVIDTILSDTDATMKINGQIALSEAPTSISLNDTGRSTAISIVVTAANGINTRTYDLTVNRSVTP
jgi:hypothetical protein